MVSATNYYFTSSAESEGSGDIMLGVRYAYLCNAGSLAFGSLVHAIVYMIRIIVDLLADYAKRESDGNPVIKCLACCAKCCVGCMSEIIEYVNKGAYAYMAISGDPYCKSAWNGYMINLKHTMEFLFANSLATMLVFFGKLMITCLNCLTGWGIIVLTHRNSNQEPGLFGPLLVIGVFTFIASTIFLSTFDDATNATIHCLAVDMELNDGVP